MRAVLGEDAVDTKRNRLTTARAKQLVAQLVHSHKNSNAIGEFETKGQSENLQLRDIILNEHTFSDSDKWIVPWKWHVEPIVDAEWLLTRKKSAFRNKVRQDRIRMAIR